MLEENNNYLKGYYFLKKKTVIEKVNVSLTASREPHISENFIRSTVIWFITAPNIHPCHQLSQAARSIRTHQVGSP